MLTSEVIMNAKWKFYDDFQKIEKESKRTVAVQEGR